ncbi:MAG: ATP-dependent zinc protease [Desulfomonilaceae bacterium]
MKLNACLTFILFAVALPTVLFAQDKKIVGWIEKAHITPGGITLDAKLDTGADSTSVNALDITKFERDGKQWARFTIDDKKGKRVTLEREIVGIKKVKRHGCPTQERYVVKLGVCVGDVYSENKVGLVDRRILKYPLLIGRDFMNGRLIPDPSVEYVTEPACKEK